MKEWGGPSKLEIYLIRHAESEINHLLESVPAEDQILAGGTFWAELTETGKMQSRLLGRYLKAQRISFDKIATSPYVRTQQTLRYAMEEIVGLSGLCTALSAVEITGNLREHGHGESEGRLREEIGHSKHMRLGLTDSQKFWKSRFPGGESPEEVGLRASHYLKEEIIGKGYSKVALFTHRGTITWLLHALFSTPIPVLLGESSHPASITKLYFDPSGENRYERNVFAPVV